MWIRKPEVLLAKPFVIIDVLVIVSGKEEQEALL